MCLCYSRYLRHSRVLSDISWYFWVLLGIFEYFGNASFVFRFHFLSHALPFLIFPVRSLTELILFFIDASLLEICARFLSFFSLYFYRFRVVLSLLHRFYRFGLVLSQLWGHVLIFSFFLFNLEPFCERCGGKLSLIYFT